MWLSAFQANALLEAKGKLKVDVTLDLGLTTSEVRIEGDTFIFPDGQKLSINDLKKIVKKSKVCFFIENNEPKRIHWFDEGTNNFYKLVPTGMKTPPTFEISGIKMHVVKEMNPRQDTLRKIKAISPVKGKVLDTCLGLGYTSIEAAKTADSVIVCEKDENVIELIKWNPWSKPVLENKKIKIINEEVQHRVKGFPNNEFDRIIHDPPRLALAPQLYSSIFYTELLRVMKPRGKLYHYTGSPGSKKRGIDLQSNVMVKLKRVGFKNVKRAHYGVVGEK